MVEQTVCYAGVAYQLMEEPIHKLEDLEYDRVFHYYDGPLTFTMRAKDTGQVYFFNYVDYSDVWDLYIQVPISEGTNLKLKGEQLSINELLREHQGSTIYYILSEQDKVTYLKRDEPIPKEHFSNTEEVLKEF